MDRNALVLRNQRLAEATSATPLKHRIRQIVLRAVSWVPVQQQRPPTGQRILLVRPDHLGDVLLTTPTIHALREALPHAEIHALVGPWSASVLANYKEIDVILTTPFPGFTRDRKPNILSPYTLVWKSARQLRKIGYSHAIILRADHWWGALMVYLAGIPERVGFDLPYIAPFLTHKVPCQDGHSIIKNLRLVEQGMTIPATKDVNYQFEINSDDRIQIDQYLEYCGINPQQRIFCIHPGSGADIKNWHSTRWAEVADRLIGQLDAQAVVTGGSHEMPLVQDIIAGMVHPAHNLAGKTGIGQLGALYGRSCVVIGPDSGPLHLAAAVGTPTVALFGPADPDQFAPWGSDEEHAILTANIQCRPCGILDWHNDDPKFHPCVRDISLHDICDAARRVAKMETNSQLA